MATDYRISQRVLLGVLGGAVAACGVLVIAVALAVGLLGLPAVVTLVAALTAVVGLAVVGLALRGGPVVVRLDDLGYRLRFLRGAGTTRARWTDVEDVVTATVAGERCVVLRLRDGRTSTVPVRVLAADADTFVKDLQGHLDRGHGYRRIR